jgi:hypothetical protein
MQKSKLTYDENYNAQIDGKYVDIRNNYNIQFLKSNKDLVFSFIKDKNILDDSPNQIEFTFFEVTELEVDFSSFSSLGNHILHFDELTLVPMEYRDIELPTKDRPYHSMKIGNEKGFMDSDYIKKYEQISSTIHFRISTKNGIDFYFTAKKLEITTD